MGTSRSPKACSLRPSAKKYQLDGTERGGGPQADPLAWGTLSARQDPELDRVCATTASKDRLNRPPHSNKSATRLQIDRAGSGCPAFKNVIIVG